MSWKQCEWLQQSYKNKTELLNCIPNAFTNYSSVSFTHIPVHNVPTNVFLAKFIYDVIKSNRKYTISQRQQTDLSSLQV